MRFHRNLIIASLLYLLGTSAQAQLISVMSRVSSDSIMIGDQVIFNIQVEAAENVSFAMPLIRDTLSSTLEVVYPISADTSLVDGKQVVNHKYMITGFEQGMQLVSPQQVVYTFGSTTDTALSMPLIIQVFEPAVDTTQQIKPIKPPINTPLTFREMLPWITVGIGGWMVTTLLMAMVWMFWQRRKDPEIFLLKPQEPAHVVAFRNLDKLKEAKLWEKGQIKQFYTRLTEITRHYIEGQYGIPAMERTTGEILDAFRRSNTGDSMLDEMLMELLELADLVKFAKKDPSPVDNQTNLNNAYLFVQKTYPYFYREDPALKNEDPELRKEDVRNA